MRASGATQGGPDVPMAAQDHPARLAGRATTSILRAARSGVGLSRARLQPDRASGRGGHRLPDEHLHAALCAHRADDLHAADGAPADHPLAHVPPVAQPTRGVRRTGPHGVDLRGHVRAAHYDELRHGLHRAPPHAPRRLRRAPRHHRRRSREPLHRRRPRAVAAQFATHRAALRRHRSLAHDPCITSSTSSTSCAASRAAWPR